MSDHLCAVYKHFGVRGPLKVNLHVSRDLSLNTLISGIFLDPLPASIFTVGPAEQSEQSGNGSGFSALLKRVETINARASQGEVDAIDLLTDLERLVADLEAFADASYSPRPRPPLYRKNQIPSAEVVLARRWAFEGRLALGHPRRVQAKALAAWTGLLVRKTENEETDSLLAELSRGYRRAGSPVISQLFEEERLRLRQDQLGPTIQLLEKLIEVYYPEIDRAYAREKWDHLLRAFVDGRSPQTQVDRIHALAAHQRAKSRWDLVEVAFRRLRKCVPPEMLPDDYFKHYPDSLRYQHRHEEAVAALRCFQEKFPNRIDVRQVIFELIVNYVDSGQVSKALALVEAHEEELSPDRAANARYLVASHYYFQKNAPALANRQLEILEKKYPESEYTRIIRNLLARK